VLAVWREKTQSNWLPGFSFETQFKVNNRAKNISKMLK